MISFFEILPWAFLACVAYTSLFEWTLHKYFMHRKFATPFFTFDYAFNAHAGVHHQRFKADHTYHATEHPEDAHLIPMAWWNILVLIPVALIPTIPFDIWYHWWIVLVCAVVLGLYYWAYERFHWCMHLPRKRNLERSGIFFRLNGHHLLHHRYPNKNFNVVFPLADLCLGTLLLRSKVHFKQAVGPSVPNVQPKPPKTKPSWPRLA